MGFTIYDLRIAIANVPPDSWIAPSRARMPRSHGLSGHRAEPGRGVGARVLESATRA
jgi:hypothetical protein